MTTESAAAQQAPPIGTGWGAVLRGPLSGLTWGLVFVTLSVATESLIIATIMPTIVRDIGGLDLYGLAFSAFFLTGLVSIPVAGWAVDRFGPSLPFAVTIGIFIFATLIAALAPSMPILVGARAVQGLGAAAQFTISQSTIARAYPPALRARALSVMSATWTVPGLLGPPLGAAITSLFGWRWAFGFILVPALLAAAFTLPQLRRLSGSSSGSARPRIVGPVGVTVGVGVVVFALTRVSLVDALAAAGGAALAVVALLRVLPAGSMTARRGLPAIVAASFFLSVSYYAASSFVTLVLVVVDGVPLVLAAAALTASTIAWTVGVWINTWLIERVARRTILTVSGCVLAVSVAVFALSIVGSPFAVGLLTWTTAGLGMGICFNTLTLNTMDAAKAGSEGAALAGRNLMANLGTAIGTGVGGAAIAVAQELALGLRSGLIAAYALAVAAALVMALLAGRASAREPAPAT